METPDYMLRTDAVTDPKYVLQIRWNYLTESWEYSCKDHPNNTWWNWVNCDPVALIGNIKDSDYWDYNVVDAYFYQ